MVATIFEIWTPIGFEIISIIIFQLFIINYFEIIGIIILLVLKL
jgi:hypothetical protein